MKYSIILMTPFYETLRFSVRKLSHYSALSASFFFRVGKRFSSLHRESQFIYNSFIISSFKFFPFMKRNSLWKKLLFHSSHRKGKSGGNQRNEETMMKTIEGIFVEFSNLSNDISILTIRIMMSRESFSSPNVCSLFCLGLLE